MAQLKRRVWLGLSGLLFVGLLSSGFSCETDSGPSTGGPHPEPPGDTTGLGSGGGLAAPNSGGGAPLTPGGGTGAATGGTGGASPGAATGGTGAQADPDDSGLDERDDSDAGVEDEDAG